MTPSARKPYRRFLRGSLLLILFIVLVDLLSIVMNSRTERLHAGAPTFTVCHGVKATGGDRYFCSNDGCYSTKSEEMTVVGSYEDGNTCAGIASNLGEGK